MRRCGWLLLLVPALVLAGGLALLTGAVRAQFPSSAAPALLPPAPFVSNPPSVAGGGCTTGWNLVASPNVGTFDNYLYGVAGRTPNDVWAVGYYYNGFASRTLIEHWDGTQWSVVPSPNVGAGTSVLLAVAAVAANDVWAVGHAGTQTLIEHWNGTAWSIVPSPSVGTGMQGLDGIGVVSVNDIWAVGHYFDAGSGAYRTLVEHWNGASWSVVPSPNVGTADNFLWGGVAVSAANDLWAVGSYGTLGARRTLALHWDGAAWSVTSSPNVGAAENRLIGVAAVAGNDVWAVGYAGSNPNEQTLVEHWDGSAWSVVPSPNQGGGQNILEGVVAAAGNDPWTAGFSASGTLTEHWDGAQWQIVPSPNQAGANYLTAIAAPAGGGLWAVGFYYFNNVRRTLTLHYTTAGGGCPTPTITRTPTRTPTATPTPVCPPTTRMVLIGPGGFQPASLTIPLGTTVRWMNEGPAVHSTTSDTGVWDSGPINPGFSYQFLFNTPGVYPYHCAQHPNETGAITVTACLLTPTPPALTPTATPAATNTPTRTPTPGGPSATPGPPTHTPTPTSTPGGPSATPVVGTATPTSIPPGTATGTPGGGTATATPCTITFTDVDQNNPFYAYIRCLACRGIVAGYADGTFRWGNDVTRGQLSKIIAGAAGLTNAIPSTQQTFSDVPNANTFWLFIERLSGVGAIAGYGCGGPGEPCDPAQRPYFRWGANATRGQISKITAVTAGWNGPVLTVQQTFTDVPSANPFWLWIEELASRHIIAGYTCGGVGEPCDPQNRPYFRWGATATRGQMSKIAAETFFPNCQTPAKTRNEE